MGVERLFSQIMFNDIYREKKVFVTGHTGFKGSWLCKWLEMLGAYVTGYSLQPPTQPNHFEVLDLKIESILKDIRNSDDLISAVRKSKAEIVFHLAAQSLVRQSYRNPTETFETNLIGTVNILEACRQAKSVKAIVVVTSDKCYENREWRWGYRENDAMGGSDPYSASKGCAELATSSYRRSFFPVDAYSKTHQTLIASVRAGNVIGGGDWAEDRLVPDIMRAASESKKVLIRNPQATRPWQHVIDPLAGYLLLGQHLLAGKKEFSGAWNFGPDDRGHKDVLAVVKQLQSYWPAIDFKIETDAGGPHEDNLLKLDCSKAHAELGWRPIWSYTEMFERTVQWYREFYESDHVCSQEQLTAYTNDTREQRMYWAKT
jgi:CDP-glucose 4,6-dehydratase